MNTKLYYKGAVNAEGQLVVTDPTGYGNMGGATFTVDEAKALELQDCRPVVVQVVRAFMVKTDVVEAP